MSDEGEPSAEGELLDSEREVLDSEREVLGSEREVLGSEREALGVERELGVSIEHRRQRIRVETQRHRIDGCITLARDGFRSRVSDVLNASERDFLILTDVVVDPLAGGPRETYRFLAVGRAHIVFAVVIDED